MGLPGRHQAANAAIVLAAVQELRRAGWTIPEAAVRRGLAEVVWPARVEVVSRRPTVVIDAAHNEASIAALVKVLDESFSARRRLLIFATTQEKDLRGMLGQLLGRFDRMVFTRYQDNPRSVPPEQLAALAASISAGPLIEVTPTPAEAWDAVLSPWRWQLSLSCTSPVVLPCRRRWPPTRRPTVLPEHSRELAQVTELRGSIR